MGWAAQPQGPGVGRDQRLCTRPRTEAEQQTGQSLEGKVRQIGAKTFYWKNNRWVDSTVHPDEDAKANTVTQLTEEYFQLARTQKAEYNQYYEPGRTGHV